MEITAGNEVVLSDGPPDQYTGRQRIAMLEKLLPSVPQQCSNIIQVYRDAGWGFYRGLRSTASILLKNIRTDRKTMEMAPDRAELLVAAYNAVDVAAHRQNSIFTTPSLEMAQAWGDLYIVFPFNGYKFSYFENIKDDYAFYPLQHVAGEALRRGREYGTSREEQVALVVDTLNERGLTQSNLSYALGHNCEVLFTGTQYYAFAKEDWSGALRRWLL